MSLRFGIMGAGTIAVKFAQAVSMVEDVSITAVSSKSMMRAQTFAAEQHIKYAFDSYQAMAQSGYIDAVYVATTGNYHYNNVILALNCGLNVLCEKSMVALVSEATSIFELAKKNKLFVMEGMWSCFIPAVQKAREWIAQGLIGQVQLVNYIGGINAPSSHRIFNKSLGGGTLYDLGVYPIEIVGYILNKRPQRILSKVRMGITNVDESFSLIVSYGDCDASLQCTSHARIPSPSGYYGTLGYIRIEKTHMANQVFRYDEHFQLVESFEHPFDNGFQFEIAHMRNCIRKGLLQSPEIPWQTTLDSAALFEQALCS